MPIEKDERPSPIKISDDVIAICAANATLKTVGVADLSSGFSDTLSKNILGRNPMYTGIKIDQDEDGITVDVYVLVEYGSKIPEVAWDIQENVKHGINEMTELSVNAVHIHIQGVVATEEKDD
jgi:uncharacterized alkaline shock family protein YloU